MTLKEFKQELINYARTLIPGDYKDYIRIPGSSETNYLQIRTTKKREVVDYIIQTFDQQNFNVQFSKNDQVPGLEIIESFVKPVEDNNKEIGELFPGKDEAEFLEEEKRRTKHNFSLVLNSPKASIHKLIEYIEQNTHKEMTDIKEKDNRQQIWNDFLKTWPVKRLKDMALEEYTNLNRSDSFCYWLEKRTEILGSIWGGSSYKFGIYKRSDTSRTETRKGYKSDNEYAWVVKFGQDKETVFNNIRNKIYEVAVNAQKGELSVIDQINLGESYKWKIAALYNENIPLIYKPEAINYLAELKNIDVKSPMSRKYEELSKLNNGKNILEYSTELWDLYKDKGKETKYEKECSMPLNQIFYGPPGTGKTYSTVSEAVRITDPGFYNENKDNRDKLRKRYNELLINDWDSPQGQIGFCTFHQSFSYEDFIEGIKPVPPDEENPENEKYLKFKVQDGILKIMVQEAETSLFSTENQEKSFIQLSEEEYKKAQFYKVSLGNINIPEEQKIYDYCIDNGYISIGFTEGINFTGKNESEVNEIVRENNLGSFTSQVINYFKNYLKKGNYVIVSKGASYARAIGKVVGDYEYKGDSPIGYNHFRKVEWIFTNEEIPVKEIYEKSFSQQTIYKLNSDWIKKDFFVKTNRSVKPEAPQNYVLIIDEINRGNISQIFGELITLIEEDKRKGKEESTKAVLPYSHKPFSIPENLFIIGTMNTADRSIEALDTALRRRFSFKEIAPDSSIIAQKGKSAAMSGIVENINLVKLLDTMNDRIEKLLDKDHRIGHSYFMKVHTLKELVGSFKDEIIPLLQEYFYGDFGKIGLILGNEFVKIKYEQDSDFSFAKFKGYDTDIISDLKQRKIYEITPSENWTIQAFQSVYSEEN